MLVPIIKSFDSFYPFLLGSLPPPFASRLLRIKLGLPAGNTMATSIVSWTTATPSINSSGGGGAWAKIPGGILKLSMPGISGLCGSSSDSLDCSWRGKEEGKDAPFHWIRLIDRNPVDSQNRFMWKKIVIEMENSSSFVPYWRYYPQPQSWSCAVVDLYSPKRSLGVSQLIHRKISAFFHLISFFSCHYNKFWYPFDRWLLKLHKRLYSRKNSTVHSPIQLETLIDAPRRGA